MQDIPLISFIIPVFNGSNYVEDAIDSILSANLNEIEIVVVNDGSTDYGRTERALKPYSSQIKLISLKKNSGLSFALNCGISNSKGRYINWLSHDDMWSKGSLNYIAEILSANISRIVYTNYSLIDGFGKILCSNVDLTNLSGYNQVEFSNFFERLITGQITGCSMFIPKEFLNYNLFDTSLKMTQDYEMWFRLLSQGEFLYVPKPLLRVRKHDESGTNSNCFTIEGDKFWISKLDDLISRFDNNMKNYLQFYIFLLNSPYRNALELFEKILISKVDSGSLNYDLHRYIRNIKSGLPMIFFSKSEINGGLVFNESMYLFFVLFLKIRTISAPLARKDISTLVSFINSNRLTKIMCFCVLFSKGLLKRVWFKLLNFLAMKLDLQYINEENFTIPKIDLPDSILATPKIEIVSILQKMLNEKLVRLVYFSNNDLIISEINSSNKLKEIILFLSSLLNQRTPANYFYE